MENLIKALQLFRKYGNPTCPTHCEHDELFIMIDPELVSQEDLIALKELHFEPNDVDGFSSFWFGSA